MHPERFRTSPAAALCRLRVQSVPGALAIQQRPPLKGGRGAGGVGNRWPTYFVFLRLRGSDHPPLTSLCMSVATGFPRLVYMTVVNSIFFSVGANGLMSIAVKLCRVACHNTSEIGRMGGGDSTLPYYLPPSIPTYFSPLRNLNLL